MKKYAYIFSSPIVRIALIIALFNAWLWVPIWVLYYRRFTDYGGVALLEGLSMAVSMMMIVPGGLLSDWIGRTRLLIVSSVFASLGAFGAGWSTSYSMLVPSILLMAMAGGLYQASIQALLYDILKNAHLEDRYERILGKSMMIQMLSAGLSSAVGGFLYTIDPRLPWFGVSILTILSIPVILTIQEPQRETLHDSFSQFLKEAGKGIRLLLQKEWRIGLPLLFVGIFLTTDSAGLWDIQAVEYGFSSTQLGFLLTATYLALATVSFSMPRLLRKVPEKYVLIGFGTAFAIAWFLSSYVVGIFGALFLIVRSMLSVTFDLKASVIWNRKIPSSIRATTLSSISIIRGLPYVFVSWIMGKLLESVGVNILVRIFSVSMILLFLWMLRVWRKEKYIGSL